jgi:hypothetical protein
LFHVPGQPANSALLEFDTKESAVVAISILDKCFLEGNEISIIAAGNSDLVPENATIIGNYERKPKVVNNNVPVVVQTPEPTPTPEPEVQQNRDDFIDDLWKSYSILLRSEASDDSLDAKERRKVLDEILTDLAQGSSAQTNGSSKSSESARTDGSDTMYMSVMDGRSADGSMEEIIQRRETVDQFLHSIRDVQHKMEASIVPTRSPEQSLNDGDWWNWVVGQQWSFDTLLDKVISSGELNDWSRLISTRLKAKFHQQLNKDQVKELERVVVIIEGSLQQMLQQIVAESGASPATNKQTSRIRDLSWAWAVFDILVNRAFREQPKLKDDILSGKTPMLPVLSSLVTLTRMNIGYHHLLLEKKVIAAELSMSDPNIELDLLTDIEEARKSIEKTLIKAYFDTRKKIPDNMVELGAQMTSLNKLSWFNVQLFMFKASFKIQHDQMKFEVFVNDTTTEANFKQLNEDINKIQSKNTNKGCVVM